MIDVSGGGDTAAASGSVKVLTMVHYSISGVTTSGNLFCRIKVTLHNCHF